MNSANKQNSESDEEDLLMVKIFLNLLISIFLFGFYKINLITPKNKNGEKEKVVEAMQRTNLFFPPTQKQINILPPLSIHYVS